MYSVRKINVNGHEFEFINESGSRGYYGFYHRTELLRDGVSLTAHRANYINRTWECYTYQTVMLGAVSDLEESRRAHLLENYKEATGFKRMTKARLEDFEKVIQKDEELQEYAVLKKHLRERSNG